MVINIYRTNPIGKREVVPQQDIDFWCQECQFSLAKDHKRCRSKSLIQQCWIESKSLTGENSAGEWHRQHECPFIHQGQECRCNDYPTIGEAFGGAGLHKGQYK